MPYWDITETNMGVLDPRAETVVQLLKDLQEEGCCEKSATPWCRPVEGQE